MPEIFIIIIELFAFTYAILNGMFGVFPMWTTYVVPVLIVLKYLFPWLSSLSLTPSKKECPTCHNQDIKLTYALGQKKGLCEKCGTSFNFYAEPDILAIQRRKRKKVIIYTIVLIIIVLVGKYYEKYSRPERPYTQTESKSN